MFRSERHVNRGATRHGQVANLSKLACLSDLTSEYLSPEIQLPWNQSVSARASLPLLRPILRIALKVLHYIETWDKTPTIAFVGSMLDFNHDNLTQQQHIMFIYVYIFSICLCSYIYIFIYVYVYLIFVHTYTTYISIYNIHTYIYTHIYVYIYKCMCIYIFNIYI
jgi:hypothetical protein